MSSTWVVHSECPYQDSLVSSCSGDCDNCEYDGHDDTVNISNIIAEIKANGKIMSESKLPHNYYKAISVKKAIEIIERWGNE